VLVDLSFGRQPVIEFMAGFETACLGFSISESGDPQFAARLCRLGAFLLGRR